MLRTPHFSTRAAFLLAEEQQMSLGWKPDTAVAVVLFTHRLLSILSGALVVPQLYRPIPRPTKCRPQHHQQDIYGQSENSSS